MNPQTDDFLEAALTNYPLAEAPSDLSQRIMQRVTITSQWTKDGRPTPRMRFRLTWMDFALGLFLLLLPVIGLVIWATLPPLVLLRLVFEWQMIESSGLVPLLSLSLTVAGGLLLSAVLFSVSFVLRPEPAFR